MLAISQAAYTPKDDEDWGELGYQGLAKKCVSYLDKWQDRFYLYGDKPFLQMPEVATLISARKETQKLKAKTKQEILEVELKAHPKSFGAGFYPDLPTENNTMLSHTLFEKTLSDADKAIFVLLTMNFAFGGKRVESDLTNLSGKIYGSKYSAKSSPSLGNYVGYLHSYLKGENVQSMLWLNLLTKEQIDGNKYWMEGLGVAPWECMPKSEICEVGENLKKSYMGCLIAMSRFVLLVDKGIYYLDGIQYPSHKEGWKEPSMAIKIHSNHTKVLWLEPNKRPWRELTSLLSFINTNSQSEFDCQHIRFGFKRARKRVLSQKIF